MRCDDLPMLAVGAVDASGGGTLTKKKLAGRAGGEG
jgi:hypothetical protein